MLRRIPQIAMDHPRMTIALALIVSVYGASAQGGTFGGVVSLEAGYYDSRDDPPGTDPAIPNSIPKR